MKLSILAIAARSEALHVPPLLASVRSSEACTEHVSSYWMRDGPSPLSHRLERIIERTPSLAKPTYKPTHASDVAVRELRALCATPGKPRAPGPALQPKWRARR